MGPVSEHAHDLPPPPCASWQPPAWLGAAAVSPLFHGAAVMAPGARPRSTSGRGRDPLEIASILTACAPEIALDLGSGPARISDQTVQVALLAALPSATLAAADVRVRADRPADQSGTWRFDLLVERADSVLAAIETCAGEDELERQVLALSRLSMAIGRGVAERGFLVAAAPAHSGLWVNPSVALASEGDHEAGSPQPSLLVRQRVGGRERPWELAIIEARPPRS